MSLVLCWILTAAPGYEPFITVSSLIELTIRIQFAQGAVRRAVIDRTLLNIYYHIQLRKEDLNYVQFPYEDARSSMVQMGLTENAADLLIGLARAINSGDILSHYQRTPENTTKTSIEEFTKEFAAAYEAQH